MILSASAALLSCRPAYMFPGFEGGLGTPVPTPVDVDAVVFLVGDAGAAESGRSPLLYRLRSDIEYWSRELGRDSAVSVVFLGDNVYPFGVRDRSDPAFPQDSARLWSQIEVVGGEAALRHKSVGLFVPGNHDWSNATGEREFTRIRNEEQALEEARETGPRVALLPSAGEPGPVVRDLRRNVRLIFFDSQWFLREPSERSRTLFLRDLGEALETAGDRQVMLLAHHPFASAGPHAIMSGGPASVGALYLLSKSGSLVQDLNSPAYGSLRERMRATFEAHGGPPLIYAAGHDHSLQVLDGRSPGDPRNILVSGSGSKLTSLGDTLGMRYGAVRPGYMMLLFRTDDTVDLYVTAGDPSTQICPASPDDARRACMNDGIRAFQVAWSETLPVPKPAAEADEPEPAAAGGPRTAQAADSLQERLDDVEAPPRAVSEETLAEHPDSVVASPGRSYAAGPLKRVVMGDLNRDLWDIEIAAPVLGLDSIGGGLSSAELSGTEDEPCLQLVGSNGEVWEFRPIVKNASSSTPDLLSSGQDDGDVQDQLGAQFPLGSALAARLMQAADVLVSSPTLVVMPDDPRLGPFREVFAGRMGWFARKPDDGPDDQPGFAGSTDIRDTAELLEALRADGGAHVDLRAFLRARLVDLYVNDWDDHARTWRWAAFPDTVGTRWVPIPGQCDWAFSRMDGLMPRVAGAIYPQYVGFGENYSDVARSVRAGSAFDRRLLGGVDRAVFLAEAHAVQEAFTDSVIESALRTLPSEYLAAEESRLRAALRARRDDLPRVAEEYYRLLAHTTDVYGTLKGDSVHLEVGPYSVGLTLRRGDGRAPGIERTFRRGETAEIRIYLMAGEDVVTVDGVSRLPMKVRLIGEPASVRLVQPDHSELLIEPGNVGGEGDLSFHETEVPPEADSTDTPGVAAAEPDSPTAWETRDWGAQWLVSPAVSYVSEFGLHLGLKVSRLGFGFRQEPWQSRLTVQALASANPFRLVGDVDYERQLGSNGFGIRLQISGYTQRHSRFYGLGNETRNTGNESYYTSLRPYLLTDASLLYRAPGETWAAWIGPRFLRWGDPEATGDSLIFGDAPDSYGSTAFSAAGVQAGLEVDARDAIDLPHSGALTHVEARAFPALGNLREPWVGLSGLLRTYWDLPGPLDPVLHVQFSGERVWGRAPYPEMASLGGRASLPGFRTGRFLGNSAVAASALVRASLFDVHTLGGIGVGSFVLGTSGRVWLDNAVDVDDQHGAWGLGLFLRSEALDRSASITWAFGEHGTRTYLGFGLPF